MRLRLLRLLKGSSTSVVKAVSSVLYNTAYNVKPEPGKANFKFRQGKEPGKAKQRGSKKSTASESQKRNRSPTCVDEEVT